MEYLQNRAVQWNFISFWRTLEQIVHGWEVLQETHLCCLKMPLHFAGFNFCWGIKTPRDFVIAQEFFGEKPYYFQYPPDQDFDFNIGPHSLLSPPEFEMHAFLSAMPSLNLASNLASDVTIQRITQVTELMHTTQLAHAIFDIPPKIYHDTATTTFEYTPTHFFLAWKDKKPVGFANMYIDQRNIACIHVMGVLEEVKRQGIGSLLLQTCCSWARDNDCAWVVLNASEEGRPFYEVFGFQMIQEWRGRIISASLTQV